MNNDLYDYENKLNNKVHDIKNNKKINENIKKIIIIVLFVLLIIFLTTLIIIIDNKKIENAKGVVLQFSKDQIEYAVGEYRQIPYELQNIKDNPLSFTSSNTDVATVDEKGNVYALKKGESIISVKTTINGKEYSDSVIIVVSELDTKILSDDVKCHLSYLYSGEVVAEIEGDAISYGFDYDSVKNDIVKEKRKSVAQELFNEAEKIYGNLFDSTENNPELKDYEKFFYENPEYLYANLSIGYYVRDKNNKMVSCSTTAAAQYNCPYYGYENKKGAVYELPVDSSIGTIGCYVDVNKIIVSKCGWNTSSKSCTQSHPIDPRACKGNPNCNLSFTFDNPLYGHRLFYKLGSSLGIGFEQLESVSEVYRKTKSLKGYVPFTYNAERIQEWASQYDSMNNFFAKGYEYPLCLYGTSSIEGVGSVKTRSRCEYWLKKKAENP